MAVAAIATFARIKLSVIIILADTPKQSMRKIAFKRKYKND